jgi:hypothetical protein
VELGLLLLLLLLGFVLLSSTATAAITVAAGLLLGLLAKGSLAEPRTISPARLDGTRSVPVLV